MSCKVFFSNDLPCPTKWNKYNQANTTPFCTTFSVKYFLSEYSHWWLKPVHSFINSFPKMRKGLRNKHFYDAYPTTLVIPVNTFSELFEWVLPAVWTHRSTAQILVWGHFKFLLPCNIRGNTWGILLETIWQQITRKN